RLGSAWMVLGLIASVARAQAPADTERKIVFDQRSDFGRVLVVDQGSVRSLRFGNPDGDTESQIDLSRPEAVMLDCIRYAAISLAYTRRVKRALVLGLGGGNFPMLLRRALPRAFIRAIEIDPVVVEAARRFFSLAEDRRLQVVVADALGYVSQDRERYDLIFHDAYPADGTLGDLWREDFLKALRARLEPGGVLVANVAMATGRIAPEVLRAFRAAFPDMACFATEERLNVILIGVPESSALLSKATLEVRARERGRALRLPFDLAAIAARMGTGCQPEEELER
ncbi:MAG: fused MFS/spermidine synthase, partial [Myxococcales bacterium]|nr:fused MFS/spermidine synthase [Myxococcales bacterium]